MASTCNISFEMARFCDRVLPSQIQRASSSCVKCPSDFLVELESSALSHFSHESQRMSLMVVCPISTESSSKMSSGISSCVALGWFFLYLQIFFNVTEIETLGCLQGTLVAISPTDIELEQCIENEQMVPTWQRQIRITQFRITLYCFYSYVRMNFCSQTNEPDKPDFRINQGQIHQSPLYKCPYGDMSLVW